MKGRSTAAPKIGLSIALAIGLVTAAATWLAPADGSSTAAVLVLAMPIGLVVASTLSPWLIRRAGRTLGVTSIGTEALERWQHVSTLVLDPFHSLTTGNLVVTEVHPIDPDHERNLRWFAGALAHSYDDPVGRAVAKLAGRGKVSNFAQEPGRGIRGSVDRHPVRVGQPEWLGFSNEDAPSPIGTTVAVDVDHRPLGRITVADEVRTDASHQLDLLRRTGLTPVLAALRTEAELERVATLSASPAWHAETDPLQLARELTVGGESVGLVHSRPGGSVSLLAVDSADYSPVPGSADSVGIDAPDIDVVVRAVTLAARAHRAQQRTLRLAWALFLLPLPFAALGFLPPLVAVAVAAVTWIVVGSSSAAEFFSLRMGQGSNES
ncbi:cation-translocating P-type ATPase [Nocardioides marmoriginsengisoli]|uniref:Cation-translocating P-type ATPase n=1 Tax=Nocardioides marmoriginsengisoli TaxID=661483 RepID=A0A3N0CG45_9ACTN|nr:cation-translocating P-type ATPase [Nocardioides marmoriginsengisoli]RNL62417.1 cation-translocating P-type ATPase [Nocardioides marmoriginsengisoli]